MAGRLLRQAPALLLSAGSACIWWVSVPRLLDLELPCPVAVLGASLFLPLAAFRQWALVTTDRQVRKGEEMRPVLDTGTLVLAASAVLLAPALPIAYAFRFPVLPSVGLVLLSDLGAALLALLLPYLAGPPTWRGHARPSRRSTAAAGPPRFNPFRTCRDL